MYTQPRTLSARTIQRLNTRMVALLDADSAAAEFGLTCVERDANDVARLYRSKSGLFVACYRKPSSMGMGFTDLVAYWFP